MATSTGGKRPRCMLMLPSALAVHLELWLLLIERERDWDEPALIVVVVTGHYNACVANAHLRPGTLGEGIDAEQTIAPVGGENREKIRGKSGRRLVCGGSKELLRIARPREQHNVLSRDSSELRRHYLAIRGRPGCRDDFIPKRDDFLESLVFHDMRGAFDLKDSLIHTNGIMAVLQVETEGSMCSMLEEDIPDEAVHDVINGRGLSKCSCQRRV